MDEVFHTAVLELPALSAIATRSASRTYPTAVETLAEHTESASYHLFPSTAETPGSTNAYSRNRFSVVMAPINVAIEDFVAQSFLEHLFHGYLYPQPAEH